MKKLLSLLLVVLMFVSVVACDGEEANDSSAPEANNSSVVEENENASADDDAASAEEGNEESDKADAPSVEDADLSDLVIGLICLHDENSTYDLNFLNAMEEARVNLGLSEDQVVIKTNIGEDASCTDAAIELVDEYDCDIVFANSFGHETHLMAAAEQYPEVIFCHSTGTLAHTEENIDNFHNAFASIYEGRYLAGIAAGMKLNEMIADGKITAEQAKIGYVGAYPYAEVKSGYTSFYLGAKSVCPSATMEVKCTGSWYNETAEREAANTLIEAGCVLISQHADSMGAPSACEQAGVPNVSYNGSTIDACPNTFIVSSRINWAPYYEYVVACWANDVEVADDWCGGIEEGSVVLTEVNTAVAAEGTVEAIEQAKAELINGTRNVFDTANFTVDGKTLTEYMADVDTDSAYTPDTQVIVDGIFMESEFRSAPYFDIDIDGIVPDNGN